ncbi:shikimate dehydrogenase (NADP(+)) [Amylibacter marinus]|uniref:Shikimate dehydrogenase (NADP(+)) n=1 Tax=Amylibacter marinus TaxID=1475483 RepID=A0ABQ5VW79_9RHOB|nr:shikimate dehydrogenase [Amylibacter marinus]GLQ35530.1 shikimate dehydrogenase (NADP(+)) [Amylibacter marinus]
MIKAAVLGYPIAQSKSPIIHGHWLKKHGIDGSYVKQEVAPKNFSAHIQEMIAQGYAGANVTVPHKHAALEIADTVSSRATAIGAANTLVFRDGKIHADNTDGEGFINNLTQGAPNWNAGMGPALVLGAGGAARAVLHALLDAGVPEIILVNRTRARAEDLASVFGRRVMVADWGDAEQASAAVSTLVNTTALGMVGCDPLHFSCAELSSNTLVNDIVYNPLKTDLLRNAEKQGCATVDGLGMLLHQAVPGFEAWFGARPQVDPELRQKVLAEL